MHRIVVLLSSGFSLVSLLVFYVTCNDISVIYVTAQMCRRTEKVIPTVGPPNAIDISYGSLTCPSYTDTGPPFLFGDSDTPPHLVAFYDTLGIRGTYSRLKPPASSRSPVASKLALIGLTSHVTKEGELNITILRSHHNPLHPFHITFSQSPVTVTGSYIFYSYKLVFNKQKLLNNRYHITYFFLIHTRNVDFE